MAEVIVTIEVQRRSKEDAGGIIDKIMSAITGPSRVKVGFPSGEVSGNNVMKAIWNEFGTAGGASGGGWGGPIPERPFMRNSVARNKSKYEQELKAGAMSMIRGDLDMEGFLTQLGIMGASDIQMEITATTSPPNSPVTIARKGSSHPLIDTGEMRQSVTWKLDQ